MYGRDVPIRRLRNQVTSQAVGKARDSDREMVLEDLIRRPAVLARFREVDVLSIGEDLTLSRIQRPNEDDLMLASSAVGTDEALIDGLLVRNAKLE
mmetsp:Transcript_65460/g.98731  ORF Transcript_65460/g.98731 Transcript_65460/m.98731 type:complete len:96 (-) Transcript_65460:170-457(-)